MFQNKTFIFAPQKLNSFYRGSVKTGISSKVFHINSEYEGSLPTLFTILKATTILLTIKYQTLASHA